MSNAAAVPTVEVSSVDPATVGETAGAEAVISGEAGTSTAAFGATVGDTATTSRAGHEGAATRLALVEEAMNGATEENDEELFLALHTFLGWRVVVNVPRGSKVLKTPLSERRSCYVGFNAVLAVNASTILSRLLENDDIQTVSALYSPVGSASLPAFFIMPPPLSDYRSASTSDRNPLHQKVSRREKDSGEEHQAIHSFVGTLLRGVPLGTS